MLINILRTIICFDQLYFCNFLKHELAAVCTYLPTVVYFELLKGLAVFKIILTFQCPFFPLLNKQTQFLRFFALFFQSTPNLKMQGKAARGDNVHVFGTKPVYLWQ